MEAILFYIKVTIEFLLEPGDGTFQDKQADINTSNLDTDIRIGEYSLCLFFQCYSFLFFNPT